jgi:DNA-binding LacI/PurR family transcriptional regulator
MKDVTITTIAAQAGVSHSTVSRALNNRPGISDRVRAQIIRLADEMGYEKKRRGRVVGIIIRLDPDGPDVYGSLLLYHLSSALKEAGFRQKIVYEHDLSLLDEQSLCGMLSLLSLNHIARYWSRNYILPLVCLNDYSDLLGGVRAVCSNDYQGIRQSVDFLSGRGHKEIALACDLTETLNSLARQKHFLNIANDYRLKPHILSVSDKTEIPPQLSPPVTALICCSEHYSEPLYRAFSRDAKLMRKMDFALWAYPDCWWYRDSGCAVLFQDFRQLAAHSVATLRWMLGETAEPPPPMVDYRFQVC